MACFRRVRQEVAGVTSDGERREGEKTNHVYAKGDHIERKDDGKEEEASAAKCTDSKSGEYFTTQTRI